MAGRRARGAARGLRGDRGRRRARGPTSIESEVDAAIAVGEVAAHGRELPRPDAYLIACFGDPGLDAARELTARPVVGIGEAAFQAACLIAGRFAIITTLRRGIPALEDMIEHRGIRAAVWACRSTSRLPTRAATTPTRQPRSSGGARRVVDRAPAEALILACGGMADVALAVQEAVGVPVCDGVAFGSMLAFGLWRCGLRTSKTGAYGWPEPIPYTGCPPR